MTPPDCAVRMIRHLPPRAARFALRPLWTTRVHANRASAPATGRRLTFASRELGHANFGELKLKLLTSIAAISAVHVLENFRNISETSDPELGWSVGIQIALVLTGVLLALMNHISGTGRQ